MKAIILLIAMSLFFACKTTWPGSIKANVTPLKLRDGWKKVSPDGKFSFHLPADLMEQKVRGIDSFVGEYRNSKIRVTFDYGIYSNDLLTYANAPKYQAKELNLSGQKARIIFYRNNSEKAESKYQGGIHLPVSNSPGAKLTVFADFNNEEEREIVNAIFETVVFQQ